VNSVSGVGVLDKAISILDALEVKPLTLNELVQVTGLSRATAHRLGSALEIHRLVQRTDDGEFALGQRLRGGGLVDAARPALEALRDSTGESVQLYVRRADQRLCIASLESPHGLRTIVPVGALLPLDVGSAGKVLRLERPGWAESVEERERGVASVSAPVYDGSGQVVAAVSVSGPVERLSRSPGRRYGSAVVRAAGAVSVLFSPDHRHGGLARKEPRP
jgi:DNA-binding IclR family transcriptional regulator